MSVVRNRRDLVLRTLDVLGLSSVGQPPAADEFAAVDAQVDAVLAALAGLDIVYVADTDEIPTEWFNPLADILALAVSIDFAVGPEETVLLQSKDAQAKADLKFMGRSRPTGQRMVAEYF